MSKHSSHHSGSDSRFSKYLLKQISKDLQSLQLWKIQDERQREQKQSERESHLAISNEELRLLKEKDDIINENFKNQRSQKNSR